MSLTCTLLLSSFSTKTKNPPKQQWSSSDPTSIPYSIRKQEFDKRNIIPNSSFEDGTLSDPNGKALSIKSWKAIGTVVEYLEITADKKNTPSGQRAIKITRTTANETDSLGSGVLSDFIPVLPGNYDFTVQLKLEKVKPQFERRGERIADAVNIRINFYDKNKKRIKPDMYYPYTKTNLDNGFKGYSFSNFFYIDKLDWSKINARTYNYPWSEGDFPDECRYVQILITLKGTGTMWVDEPNLSFSKWNFTPEERISWYKEKEYNVTELIVPTPQHIQFKENIALFEKNGNNKKQPTIILETIESTANNNTLRFLTNELQKAVNVRCQDCQIITSNKSVHEELENASIIFRLSDYTKCDTSAQSKTLPGFSHKKENYIITSEKIKNTHVITLAARDEIGLYYAATTIARLLDKNNATYNHCELIDYPAYQGRGFQLTPWKNSEEVESDKQLLDYLTYWRFNVAYFPYYQNVNAKQWYKPNAILENGTKVIGDYAKAKGNFQLGVMFNPYNHFEYEMYVPEMSDSLKRIWTHNEHGMEQIKHLLKNAFDNGSTTLMLLADDFVPHRDDFRKLYDLWDEEDINRHTNLQTAQAYMVNDLYKWLHNNYGDIRFELCPPWYLNEFIDRSRGRAESYFKDLNTMIPKDVSIIWTGNTVRSLSFDKADVKRYADLCGREPMLWDNTLYARSLEGIYGGYPSMYPDKIKLCNLFEPWDVAVPENYEESSPYFYSNGLPNTEIYKIKYATLADFQWNPKAYNPEESLWRVLLSTYGKETAADLIVYNQYYFNALEKVIKIERKIEKDASYIQTTQEAIKNLKEVYKTLTSSLQNQNPALLKELSSNVENMEKRISNAIDKQNGGKEEGKRQI